MGDSTRKTSYLFVNKTVSSNLLSRSQPGESSDILSHVQQRRRRLAGGKSKERPWTQYTSYISPDEKSAAGEGVKERSQSPALLDSAHGIGWSSSLSILNPSNNNSDPFDSTVVGHDPSVHHLLQFGFKVFAAPVFLSEAFAPLAITRRPVQIRHSDQISQRIKLCVDNEMLMYATLAFSSSCKAIATGQIENGRSPEYYVGKTLPIIRSHLLSTNPTIDKWVLLSIYSLAIVQMWCGMPDIWVKCPKRQATLQRTDAQSRKACRIHLEALDRLINSNGGWEALNPYVFESMILCDKFLAIYEMEKPIIPLFWDPGPVVPFLSKEERQSYGAYFPKLGRAFKRDLGLCCEITCILEDIADFLKAAQLCWSRLTLNRKEESWLYLRMQALVCRLLIHNQVTGMNKCVRLTALLFLQIIIPFELNQIGAAYILSQLKAAILETAEWQDSSCYELKLWCLCTGAMVAKPFESSAMLFESMISFVQILGLDLMGDDLHELLENFLYIPERQHKRLVSIINEIHEIRTRFFDGIIEQTLTVR